MQEGIGLFYQRSIFLGSISFYIRQSEVWHYKKTSNVTPHRFLLLLYRVLKTIQVQHRAWHSDIFGLETRSETRLPNLSTKYVRRKYLATTTLGIMRHH